MPLSKAKNRERMRKIRLHALLLPPQKSKSVQPKPMERPNIDADGNAIPEY